MLKRSMAYFALGLVLVAGLCAPASSRAATATTEPAWLGVYTQTLDDDLRDGMEYTGDGVLVNRVVTDGPAYKAGIRRGDVIVSVNAKAVTTASQLTDLVQGMKKGQVVAVKVNRDNAPRSFNVTLGSRPADEDDDWDEAPLPPRAPRAPTAPHAPRVYHWEGGPGEGGVWMDGPGNRLILPGVGRGRLGVTVQDLDPDLAGYFAGTKGKGVLVTRVMDGTPAEDAGIKAGDVITKVGADSVTDTEDLQRALRSREGKVSLTLVRKGASRTLEATLPDRDDELHMYGMPNFDKMRWFGDDGDRRIVRKYTVHDGDGDSDSSGDEIRREVDDLKREVRELRRQLEAEPKKK